VESWRRNVAAVTAASFVGFTGFTLVMPFLAGYMGELGVTDVGAAAVWTGVTLGVTPAVTALCAPLWGRVGDRVGNKLLLQRSLLSCVIVMVLMARATEPWHLLALRAVQGLVAGYGPLTIAMAALSAPAGSMARAIGTVQTAQRVGPAIGPLIGGLLAAAVGLRNAFFVSAGVFAVALVMVTILYREPRRTAATSSAPVAVTLRDVLRFENLRVLMLVILGLQLVDRSFGPILLLHVTQLGYGPDDAAVLVGVLFSVLALCGALGNQVTAATLERTTSRGVIGGAVLVAAGALALFAFGRSGWALVSPLAVVGVAVGPAATAAFTAAGGAIPRHAHGVGFGFLSSAALIGSALSPVLAGVLAAGSIRVVFLAGAALLALLVPLVRLVMVERGGPAAPAPPADEE
jgi:MFS family permease